MQCPKCKSERIRSGSGSGGGGPRFGDPGGSSFQSCLDCGHYLGGKPSRIRPMGEEALLARQIEVACEMYPGLREELEKLDFI